MATYPADRRQRALELAREGKFGGAKYGKLGGRPRVPRAGEIAAREACVHAEKIVEVFLDGIHPDQPIEVRLRAAIEWLRIEAREHEGLRVEDVRLDFEQFSQDDLVAAIMNMVVKRDSELLGDRVLELPAVASIGETS